MKVTALAGGTGSAKLLRGLARSGCDLTVVANVGDNFRVHGLYVCPDIDIATYTLAGLADRERGWGVAGDTHQVLSGLGRVGGETWFTLGDKDLATNIRRTEMLASGRSLTFVTDYLRRRLGVPQRILPATDSDVQTYVGTRSGMVHLQEFWVRGRGRQAVTGVAYRGAARASPTREVTRAVMGADRVVVCPANPVTSIGPMLAIPGFRGLLSRAGGRVVALSPMKGGTPFSGPAMKLMKAVGSEPSSYGVARLYSGFLDALLASEEDRGEEERIAGLGVECGFSDTSLATPADEDRLARELLSL